MLVFNRSCHVCHGRRIHQAPPPRSPATCTFTKFRFSASFQTSSQSSSEVDEEPVAKLARFTENLIAEQTTGKVIPFQFKKKLESKTDDDNDCRFATYFGKSLIDSTNGFDADSEGSDCEIVPNGNNTIAETKMESGESCVVEAAFRLNLNAFSRSVTADYNGNPKCETFEPIENAVLLSSMNGNLSKTTTTTTSLPITVGQSPTQATKRPRKVDSSKFNRSNRKSKNCAIFYFKHLDTDAETTHDTEGFSSHDGTSELCSEDD